MIKRDPFIMLPYTVYDSPQFAALEPIHIAIFLLLIRKHNGQNNGSITLGVREAAKRCHCSQATACRALGRLQKDGLISITYKGHLVPEIGRPDVATRWQLNFLDKSTTAAPPPSEIGGSQLKQRRCFPGEASRASQMKHRGAFLVKHH
jgi:hypothetical protein